MHSKKTKSKCQSKTVWRINPPVLPSGVSRIVFHDTFAAYAIIHNKKTIIGLSC